jgi:hypothetical protein
MNKEWHMSGDVIAHGKSYGVLVFVGGCTMKMEMGKRTQYSKCKIRLRVVVSFVCI